MGKGVHITLSSQEEKVIRCFLSVTMLDTRPSSYPLLARKQMESQLVLTEAIPSPGLRGFYIGVSCIRRVVVWTSSVWELNPDPCRGSSV